MTAPTNPSNEAPREALDAPESAQSPGIGPERRPGGLNGPQNAAQSLGEAEPDCVVCEGSGVCHACVGIPMRPPAAYDGPTVAEAKADDAAHWADKYDQH